VTAQAQRWRPRQEAVAAGTAMLVGAVVRQVGRTVPGVVGPLLVAVGLWMAWTPLGVVFAGAVLWALDRRV
jgi:hypothetical protein